MGLSVREQIEQRKKTALEETAQVATSQATPAQEVKVDTPVIGTEGSEITPVDGVPIKTDEEMTGQFISDFGEEIDGGLIAQMIDDVQPPEDVGITQQENPNVAEHDVISPTGQVVTQKDPSKAAEDIQTQQQVQPKVETPTEVNLDNYVAKTVHDETVRLYNDLQCKFGDLQGKVNRGLEGMKDDELLTLKQIKYDIENTPFGFIAKDYYDGKINANRLIDSKPVNAYMTDGVEYDPVDAVNTPGSESWNARVKWEDENVGMRDKYAQASQFVQNELKSRASQPNKESMEKEEQQLRDKLYTKIPQAKVNESVFNAWLKKQSNIYFPLYVAFAQEQKLSKGKRKIVPSVQASDTTIPVTVGVRDTADKEMSDEFGD